MATSMPLLQEHLSCPICSEIFTNPVVLQCSHSFCQECLQQSWENAEDVRCPVCRKECSVDEPRLSLAFKSLCESLQRGKEVDDKQDICQQHGERLKLFCMDDKQPLCVVCHTSKMHRGHECYPTEEAAAQLKGEIKSLISSLNVKLNNIKSSNSDLQTWKDHIEDQAQRGEERIRAVFKELHQFLEEEEAVRIAELRKEEEEKCQVLKRRMELLSTLSETVKDLTDETEAEDITFLQNYKAVCDRTESTLGEPAEAQKISRAFIDVAKHTGSLEYKVGKKMLEIMDYTPVTMDPNTACVKLQLSDDLTSLNFCEESLNVPNNPERLQLGVLGSEGFSYGSHYWDVEVGDCDNWTLGVVNQAFQRKKLPKMDGKSGLWSIRYISGKYRAGVKSRQEIKVDTSPKVIRVMLDCDKGEVKFFDLTNKKELYTFKEKITAKVFPYFNSSSVICPLRLLKIPIILQ